MKKALTILCISLSFVIILDTFNASEAIFMFFLAGVIPGTNITISAARMLEVFMLLTGFILSRVTISLVRLNSQHRQEQNKLTSIARTRAVRI